MIAETTHSNLWGLYRSATAGGTAPALPGRVRGGNVGAIRLQDHVTVAPGIGANAGPCCHLRRVDAENHKWPGDWRYAIFMSCGAFLYNFNGSLPTPPGHTGGIRRP